MHKAFWMGVGATVIALAIINRVEALAPVAGAVKKVTG